MANFLTDEQMAELEAREQQSVAPQAKTPGFISDEEMAAIENPKTSQLESGVMGAVEGASLGFVDELAGGLEALGSKVGLRGVGGGFADIRRETPEEDALSFSDVYKQGRDSRRATYEQSRLDNPATFNTAKIGGGIASGIAAPVGRVTSLAKGAGVGAGMGALTGFGESQGDLEEQGMDALRAGGLGGALGAAGAGLSKLMTPAASAAKDQAARSAYSVTGGLKSDINKLYNQTPGEVGQELLDRGLITLGTKRGSRELSEKIMQDLGKFRTGQDKFLQTIDEAAPNSFDVSKVIGKIRKTAGEYGNMGGSGNQSFAQSLNNEADILSELYKNNPKMSLQDALILKRNFDQGGKFQSPLSEVAKVEAARASRKTINREIDDVISELVNPQVSSAYNQTRQGASRLMSAKSALEQAQMREQANKTLGLTDLLSGGAGAAAGAVVGGPVAIAGIATGIAANKALTNYGSSTAALGLQGASRVLGNTANQQTIARSGGLFGGQIAGQNNKEPEAVVRGAMDLNKRIQFMPPKYKQTFDRALEKGGNAAAVTHHTLFSRDPEYRKLMQEMDEQAEQ